MGVTIDWLVPGGGIEPSTHGFSVSSPEFHNFLKLDELLEQWTLGHYRYERRAA